MGRNLCRSKNVFLKFFETFQKVLQLFKLDGIESRTTCSHSKLRYSPFTRLPRLLTDDQDTMPESLRLTFFVTADRRRFCPALIPNLSRFVSEVKTGDLSTVQHLASACMRSCGLNAAVIPVGTGPHRDTRGFARIISPSTTITGA